MLKFKDTYSLPFKYSIPNNTEVYLKDVDLIKRWIKYIKRSLYLLLSNQQSKVVQKIDKHHYSILWINMADDSIGDSLMDLSSRTLLKDREITLLTKVKNYHIYKDDKIFRRVLLDQNKIIDYSYDLVIVDSYSPRSLSIKNKYLNDLPFVSMYGHYNGSEINRTLFSFHRMNQLLGYNLSKKFIEESATTSIFFSEEDVRYIENINIGCPYIVIVVGGEWEYRIYRHWQAIIEHILDNYPQKKIVLVGSKNAIIESDFLTKNYPSIISYVAQLSFNQTALLINRGELTLCSDGGLMHAAASVNTKIIALFSKLSPSMRITNRVDANTIYSKDCVSDITSRQIIEQLKLVIA